MTRSARSTEASTASRSGGSGAPFTANRINHLGDRPFHGQWIASRKWQQPEHRCPVLIGSVVLVRPLDGCADRRVAPWGVAVDPGTERSGWDQSLSTVLREESGDMFAAERRQAILGLIHARGAVSLHDLAVAVNSSEVTVRRDIQALERDGLVDRRRGGAALPGGLSHEQSYRQKSLVASAEKAGIAAAAAALVAEGDAIVIGAGTTTEEFTRRLVHMKDLTVVTNSLLVANVLARTSVVVVMTGG